MNKSKFITRKSSRTDDEITDYFCGEKNYYYDSWINGNKNHVITHLRIFSTSRDSILYNSILKQFTHDEDLLNSLLERVSAQAGTFINKAYL